MSAIENPYPRIANNFLHDMATGTWAACLLVLLVLRSYYAGLPPQALAALGQAAWGVFWLLIGALVVLAVTGWLRLAYWRSQTAAADVAAKRRSLIVKHAAFAVVYGVGTFVGYLLLPR